MLSRRAFLEQAGSGALAAWMSAWISSEVRAEGLALPESLPATDGGILQLRLQGRDLEALEKFYRASLGFKTQRTPSLLKIQAGGTSLEFALAEDSPLASFLQAGSPEADSPETGEIDPTYHIAWAIPENKLAVGKRWLASRTRILKDASGRDEFHFRRVNRTGVYFADPAGNILELIARHGLDDGRPGPFTTEDLLYVNHVGLAVDDVAAAVRELHESVGLDLRAPAAENFASVGDAHRHLTLVSTGRLWIPERKLAAGAFPTDILLHGSPKEVTSLEGYPYQIRIGSQP